jgi:hypothetical protein
VRNDRRDAVSNFNRSAIVYSLRGVVCPACGGPKRARQSFCYGDYKRLSDDLKRRIYSLLGRGYEEAFAESMRFLGATAIASAPPPAPPAATEPPRPTRDQQLKMFGGDGGYEVRR